VRDAEETTGAARVFQICWIASVGGLPTMFCTVEGIGLLGQPDTFRQEKSPLSR